MGSARFKFHNGNSEIVKSLAGGSVSWNNTTKTQTRTYCTWQDLDEINTITIPFSGKVSSAKISGDSWSITIRLKFADGTTLQLIKYTNNASSINETFTVDVSGYTAEQKKTVSVEAYGSYSYSSATNRYTSNSTTVGTSTATS